MSIEPSEFAQQESAVAILAATGLKMTKGQKGNIGDAKNNLNPNRLPYVFRCAPPPCA
jgi:hypothetical protein